MKSRGGFTLIEMILFVAIFAVTMGAFMAVFTNVAAVQVRQNSIAEVQSQSQFLLRTIQYYVERASLVELVADTPTTTLLLRMASSTEDPVVLSLNGTAVQLSSGGGAAQDITSSKVKVSGLSFINRRNPGGHDAVSVAFTVAYATENPRQNFEQSLQIGVSRSSAATFEYDVLPADPDLYKLGVSAEDWRSINSTIFFSGSNVGISASVFAPSARLHVQGSLRAQGGDVYIKTTGDGVVLTSPSSTCWRLAVSDAGAVSASSVTCP